jgi:hypothetical protein
MINHLWPDRREIQTLYFGAGGRAAEVALALLPLARLARSRWSALTGGPDNPP